jgi:hypothetical protein
MPLYRIHRMKDHPRQQFRWQPHTGGASNVKPRDYEPATTVEANSAYSAWALLRDSGSPLLVGDLLESEDGALRIYKYVGFEEARWVLPELKTGLETAPVASGAALDDPAA